MNIDRLLRHTRSFMEMRREADKQASMAPVGALIGHELPRNRLWILRSARAELAKIHIDDEYGRGYKEAVQDILFSYESAVEENIRNMIRDPDAKHETDI